MFDCLFILVNSVGLNWFFYGGCFVWFGFVLGGQIARWLTFAACFMFGLD